MELIFCYRIEAECEMAETETGEPAAAYMRMTLQTEKEPDNYGEAHKRIGAAFAKDHGWLPEWVTPISQEEHDRESADEDDDC